MPYIINNYGDKMSASRYRQQRSLFFGAILTAVAVASLVACGRSDEDAALSPGNEPGSSKQEVLISRDKMGVPFVQGATAEAVLYGAGYASAQDRLFQIEFLRRTANGSLAELLGPSVLEMDKEARIDGFTDSEMRAQIDALPEEHKKLFKAMVKGANAYIAKAIEEPKVYMPLEFEKYGISLKPITEEDAARMTQLTVRTFGGTGGNELNNLAFLAEMQKRHGSAKAQKIFDDIVVLDDPDADTVVRRNASTAVAMARKAVVIPRKIPASTIEVAQKLRETRVARAELMERIGFTRGASRSLIVGPQRSADGKVMMMQSTADGYDMSISGGGLNASGLTIGLLGAPVMGRGFQHGWLITTGESDTIDVMEHDINPSNPGQYRYNGAWKNFESREETINVRGSSPVKIKVLRSVQGPIFQMDEQAGKAYARRNAVWGRELQGFVSTIEFGRAKSLAEFRQAASAVVQNFNLSYGGEDGHIEIWHSGLQPVRPAGVDPRLPAKGDGSQDWQGFVPFDRWVNEANPKDGYFHAWNNKASKESTYGDTSRYGETFRTWMAHDLMAAKPKVTMADMKNFNYSLAHGFGGVDLSSTSPKFFQPYLEKAVREDADPRRRRAVELMVGWNALREDKNGDDKYDSAGQTIFENWRALALKEVFNDVIGDWAEKLDAPLYVKYRTSLLLRALKGKAAGKPFSVDYLNGRDIDAVVRKTLDTTLAEMEKKFGTADMNAWLTPVAYKTFSSSSLMGSLAVDLGKIPAKIKDNGNENWNAIMKIDASRLPIETLIPTGGQSWFINTSGTASPHISDQVERHRDLDFKSVATSDKDAAVAAVGTPIKLTFAP
jgi:penicillin amidase